MLTDGGLGKLEVYRLESMSLKARKSDFAGLKLQRLEMDENRVKKA